MNKEVKNMLKSAGAGCVAGTLGTSLAGVISPPIAVSACVAGGAIGLLTKYSENHDFFPSPKTPVQAIISNKFSER